jgi:hypothetical protein
MFRSFVRLEYMYSIVLQHEHEDVHCTASRELVFIVIDSPGSRTWTRIFEVLDPKYFLLLSDMLFIKISQKSRVFHLVHFFFMLLVGF